MARYGGATVVQQAAGPWGFFFLLAYIGAAIYFISASDGHSRHLARPY